MNHNQEVQRKKEETASALATKNAQTDLMTKLKASQDAEMEAKKSLEDLRHYAASTEKQLQNTQDSLDDVRGNLRQTRDDLSEQSTASLLTALSDSDQKIRTLGIYIPFTKSANQSGNVIEALLPAFNDSQCEDLTGVDVEFIPARGDTMRLMYSPDDRAVVHKHGEEKISFSSRMIETDGSEKELDLSYLNQAIGQTSSNKFAYFLEANTTDRPDSAASLYSSLINKGTQSILIQMSWPTTFKTLEAYRQQAHKYSSMLEDIDEDFDFAERQYVFTHAHHREYPYPPPCSRRVQSYFEKAFDKAALIIVLDRKQDESIFFRLKALAPFKEDGLWTLPFILNSTPLFTVSDRSDFGVFNEPMKSVH